MPPFGFEYAADPMVTLYLSCAFLIAGLGAGVLLFERFTESSRRVFLFSMIVGAWVALLGMTHGSMAPGAEHFWLRAAYLIMPFMAPAMYAVARYLCPGGGPPTWAVWTGGGVFAVTNAVGPWLVEGLQSLLVGGTLAGAGWLGAFYLVFEVGGVLGSLGMLVGSRVGAPAGAVGRERVLILVGSVAIVLPFLDYVLARDPFRAGLLTPLGFAATAVVATILAIRYRLFAPGHSFATDEVLRAMSDAVLVCDALGRIRRSNSAAHRQLGFSGAQLMGSPVGDIVGWLEDDRWRAWSPEEGLGTLELDLLAVDGTVVRVSASIEPIWFGTRAVGAVIVARDIRDRIETERLLQASQRRYTSLFWHNPGISYEFDGGGRFVAVNPAAEEFLGVAAEELTGRSFEEIIHPADRDLAREVFDGVLAGQAREYEIRVIRANGEEGRIRGVSIPIFEGSEVTGVFGVALDVTAQSRVKKELEVQRRYFAELFESSPEGIVLVTAENDKVLRVNAEFTRMFGYTAEEAVGRKLSDLIVPDERAEEGLSLNRQARTAGGVRTETVRRRKDGTAVQVSLVARELRIPGEPHQLYGVYRDITDRKATERALHEREEELRHAQRLEAVGKLAGGVAHDFNNLLTVINGHVRFALDNAEAGCEVKDDLTEIERAGTRAASLTQQLLAYSRRQMLHPKVLDPNVVVRELEGMLLRLIGEHIRIETRLVDAPVRVRADRGQLEQVLVNLVVNARDAMPDGGTLSIETDVMAIEPGDDRVERWQVEPGEFLRLRIADTGIGMDSGTLEHAFEPFFTTKERGKGTGLGLATVFGIVKQSAGHVTARSEPGAGTVCDVVLPLCDASPPARSPESDEVSDEFPGGSVLVVEDEQAVRQLVVRTLEREGCTVLSAENGVRALDVLDRHGSGVDLVVTDLIMPEMGGWELAEQLRRRHPEVRILFISGYDDALATDGGRETDFLAKPFTPAVLAERVAEIMRLGTGR